MSKNQLIFKKQNADTWVAETHEGDVARFYHVKEYEKGASLKIYGDERLPEAMFGSVLEAMNIAEKNHHSYVERRHNT